MHLRLAGWRSGPESRLGPRRLEARVRRRAEARARLRRTVARPRLWTVARSGVRADTGRRRRLEPRARPWPGLPGRPHWRRRTPAGHRRRRRPAAPPAALAIPGPVAVVVGPVAADHERDDGHADHRGIAGQRHALLLVGIVQ